MDVTLAAFRLVRNASCGAERLAEVLGKSASTLYHEVSPTYRGGAKLGLRDAVTLSVATGDAQILEAFALEMGRMVVPLVLAEPGTDGVAALTAKLAREFSDLVAELSKDLADGHVSSNERARIEREASELMAALQKLLQGVRAMEQRAT